MSEDQVYEDENFRNIVFDELNQIGTKNKLSRLEMPKGIYLTKEAFSVENNILTPTFKLKRNVGRVYFKE